MVGTSPDGDKNKTLAAKRFGEAQTTQTPNSAPQAGLEGYENLTASDLALIAAAKESAEQYVKEKYPDGSEEPKEANPEWKVAAREAAARIVEASHAAGRPVIPPGGREDVLVAMNRSVANLAFGQTYRDALTSERERLGVRTTLVGSLPEDEILRGGFGCLADDQLATMAIDPGVVQVMCDLVARTGPWAEHNPDDVGQWYTDAVMREVELPESE